MNRFIESSIRSKGLSFVYLIKLLNIFPAWATKVSWRKSWKGLHWNLAPSLNRFFITFTKLYLITKFIYYCHLNQLRWFATLPNAYDMSIELKKYDKNVSIFRKLKGRTFATLPNLWTILHNSICCFIMNVRLSECLRGTYILLRCDGWKDQSEVCYTIDAVWRCQSFMVIFVNF